MLCRTFLWVLHWDLPLRSQCLWWETKEISFAILIILWKEFFVTLFFPSDPFMCSCWLDYACPYGSWFQPPWNWFSWFCNNHHSIHFTGLFILFFLNFIFLTSDYAFVSNNAIPDTLSGWNFTLHERSGPFLVLHCYSCMFLGS